jgi:hypothetical protein
MTPLSALVQTARREGSEADVAKPALAPAIPFFSRDAVRFATVLVQFGLLVLLIRQFDIERGPLGDVMVFAWFGFAIHHFLPYRLRLPFFAFLSIASIPVAIGLKLGAFVLCAGFLLIGICHLRRLILQRAVNICIVMTGFWVLVKSPAAPPLGPNVAGVVLGVGFVLIGLCLWLPSFWQRVYGVALVLLILLFLRQSPYAPLMVIIGSMFMFRLIIYLHDLRTGAAPYSLFRATSYFFMLPNVCFPLFPLVDYKTFCSTYFNEESSRIYQTGMRWAFRGVVQLLLYRVIYQFVQQDPLHVHDLGSLALFIVTTYLLYLRVSGQFHLIVGVLHLFGFNLPETHHLYLLASSFTDLWRRINIYWKEFILKIFFYPVSFRLKHWGPIRALTAATILSFFATWVLHAYQTYWLRGTWAFSWQDAVFWWVLASLVLVNSLSEAKRGRQRTLQKAQRNLRRELGHALKVIGTFVTMCLLWTLWSSESGEELVRLAAKAGNVTLPAVAAIIAVLLSIGVAGVLFGRSTAERTEGIRASRQGAPRHAFWPSVAVVAFGTIALLLFGESHRLAAAHDTAYAEFVQSLRADRLNEVEYNARTRGYYEDLDVTRTDPGLRVAMESVGWWPIRAIHTECEDKDFLMYRPNKDFQLRVPGHDVIITYNKRGMRGPEYPLQKGPGVFRIALIGSSAEAGRGVSDHETFAHLLEERLNRDDIGNGIQKFELWNFSVEGYGALQKLAVVEEQVIPCDPDLIIWVTYALEGARAADQLGHMLQGGYKIPARFEDLIADMCQKARVDASMNKAQFERLIRPYMRELVDASFQRFAELCRTHGKRGCFLYRPGLKEFVHIQAANRDEMLDLARKTELPILDLAGCFSTVADTDSLMVSPESKYRWKSLKREAPDDHPNAAGHELMFARLYELLHTPGGSVLLKPTGRK